MTEPTQTNAAAATVSTDDQHVDWTDQDDQAETERDATRSSENLNPKRDHQAVNRTGGGEGSKQASGGDDERQHREHIEATNEPLRNEIGNAYGAS